MKKVLLFFVALTCYLSCFAWTSPVAIPDVGDARLHVVGWNVQNYLTDFTASNSSCASEAEFVTKTNKMANAFLALQADIVAICEVQANDEVLGFIAEAMNTIYGQAVYTFVTDGLYEGQSEDGYQPIKSGFIYRNDKLALQGTSTSPYYNGNTYELRLRIQAFKEISSGEVFTLSLNHFKAKSGSGDQGESTRLKNVSQLLKKLNTITYDPDILLVGDMNAYVGEAPIVALEEAGYTDLLVKYGGPDVYSYIYYGVPGLLDHAMANESMETQVTGAALYHLNTAGGWSYKFSDHDGYVVGLNLGNSQAIESPQNENAARKIIRNGVFYIEIDGHLFDVLGNRR